MPKIAQEGKAMVVDDSKAIRLILSRALEEIGWQVTQAINGKEAWRAIEAQPEPVKLVLVDWNMPEMNGLEFIRRVRKQQRYDETKLMMVTTETDVNEMVTALEAGANEYVMKPFTKEIIQDKVRILGF